MEASIIVPVYNGVRTIERCLESLLALTHPGNNWELICVDNASTDGTPEILKRFQGTIKAIRETARGAAAARNAGLRIARGKWIAFTDADCTVHPHWLTKLLEPLRSGVADAVGGRIATRPGAGWIEQLGDWVHDHRSAIENSWPPYLISMNMAAPRALLEKHGGFDERWLRSQDSELAFRLASAGCRFVYSDEAVITHYHRSTVRGLCREGFLHGYYGAELYRVYRELDAQRVETNPKRFDKARWSWQMSAIQRIYLLSKRAGWAAGKRYPPRSLRSPLPVLLHRETTP